uniref:Branched-chain-amino-acid aminotransferase n=1 Tax=Leersia perrieri TaxID=77586 RepID=A0A0D9VRJ9_9ORYZ
MAASRAHHALARILGSRGCNLRGTLPTIEMVPAMMRAHGMRRVVVDVQGGVGRWSLVQRRWRASLPQLDSAAADRSDEETGGDVIDWDNLGFGLTPTDYMYVMRCAPDQDGGVFSRGELARYGNIELSPSSGVINYGQGLFEGLKAYRAPTNDCSRKGSYMLFRPEENALRMQHGAERMCMPSPSVEQFVHAVKQTVLANRRWVPPQGKGALYIRPLLIGSGPILGLAPAPEYTFLIYAAPVGTYFKEGLSPINLLVEDEIHRAMPGGTGGVKTITNYAPVLKPQMDAKSKGFSDVLYLDAVHRRYIEEASSCNLFIVKGGVVATPATVGTILPGITRKSIIELARDRGYQVEERLVSIDDLIDADEVFCTGTAVVVAPVSTVTHQGQRYEFRTGQDTLSQALYTTLTSIQMGLAEDKKGWTVAID